MIYQKDNSVKRSTLKIRMQLNGDEKVVDEAAGTETNFKKAYLFQVNLELLEEFLFE